MDNETSIAKRNGLKMFLGILVVFVAIIAVGYQYYQSKRLSEVAPGATKSRELTEEEKRLKAQNDELDALHAAYQAANPTQPTTTAQSQSKKLDTLRAQAAVMQKKSAPVPQKTLAEQNDELDALRAAATKQ